MRNPCGYARLQPIAVMRMLFRPEYFLVAVLATTGLYSPPPSVPLYVRMSLVESPLELSQLDRCELAADLKGDRAGTWVFFYGQVERGASGSWEALRARTACNGACGVPRISW